MVILIVLGLHSLSGLRQGLVRQVLGLAGVILALVLAFQNFEGLGRVLLDHFQLPPPIANMVAFCLIVVAVFAVMNIIGYLWSSVSRVTPLSLVDSVGGAAFGFLKGAVVVGIVIVILMALPVGPVRDALGNSTLARHFLNAAPVVYQRIEQSLPANVPRFLITPEGIQFRRVDFSSLEGARCIACGGRVKYMGMVRRGLASSPKFVCTKCGRISDGCQTYQGFHLIYGECPVEKSQRGYRLDCRVWPNGKFVVAPGPCPVCGARLK